MGLGEVDSSCEASKIQLSVVTPELEQREQQVQEGRWRQCHTCWAVREELGHRPFCPSGFAPSIVGGVSSPPRCTDSSFPRRNVWQRPFGPRA